MILLGPFRDLCSAARARGLFVELHFGEAKQTAKRETYRDLTEIRVTPRSGDRIPYRRSTSWRTLSEDSRVLLEAMTRLT